MQATNALANEMTAALLTVQNGVRCFDDDQVLLCLLDMQLRAGLGEDDAGLRSLLNELVVRAGTVGLSRAAAEDKIRCYRNDHPVPLDALFFEF